jgi:AcrR family transcriptional regulator
MSEAGTSAYQRGREQGEQALRSSLLDVAGSLVADGGSDALTMRRLAEASGCSTTVLYRLFGGKEGVVRGLYREGFDRLRARLDALPDQLEPLQHLGLLAGAYREHALAEPDYYAVMFARPVPEFEPTTEDVAHARTSLQVLTDAVATAQAAGHLDADVEAQHVAEVLWAAAHGAVSLELAGHLTGDTAASVFADLTTSAAAHFRRESQGGGRASDDQR